MDNTRVAPTPAPARSAGEQRVYTVDVTVSPQEDDMIESLERRWDAQVGRVIPIPPSSPVGAGDYRIRIRHSKIDDAVVEDLYSESIVGGTGGRFEHLNDRVVVHLGRRGTWRFTRSDERGDVINMARNQFVARRNDRSWDFGIGPRTRSTVLILPTADLGSLFTDRAIVGTTESADLRLLMAHVTAVQQSLTDLSPAAVKAARNALVELTRAVVSGEGPDPSEPQLAVALADAARSLADSLLTDAELSPHILASELHVSLRTLQRAFATTGESASSYIRRRRLAQAHQVLTAGAGSGSSISEVAARYHFADASHFVRAFKREYGEPPSRLARRTPEPEPQQLLGRVDQTDGAARSAGDRGRTRSTLTVTGSSSSPSPPIGTS
ncbi:helix-turn-helix transcriptional regulator [Kribbella sp. NPDC051137]|uniref:AraC family transcriptional regulator n=1 Tax=Kribbella sp. NPDC051137 TaxID=3155045 RepID=UPI00341A75BB